MGTYDNGDYLTRIIGDLGFNIYIHEYIYNNEIIYQNHASEQLDKLITSGEIVILYERALNGDEQDEYESICTQIAPLLKADLSKHRDRNVGEVKSLAMAFVKRFGYFISDDKRAAIVSNDNLVYLDDTRIKTYKLRDILIQLKTTGKYKRSELKRLYTYYANPILQRDEANKKKAVKILKKLKIIFDNEIWPQC